MSEMRTVSFMFLMNGGRHAALSMSPSAGVNKWGGVNALMSWRGQYWLG